MELRIVLIFSVSLLLLQPTSGLQVIVRNATTTAAPSTQTTSAATKAAATSASPLPIKTSTTISPKPQLSTTTTKKFVRPTTTSKPPAVLSKKHENQPQISKRIFDTGEKNISAIEIPSLEFEIPEEIQSVIDEKNSFFTNLLNQTITTTHRIPNALATLGNFTLIQGIALIAISGLVIGIGIIIGEAWSLKKGEHEDKFGLKGHHQHHGGFEDDDEGWGWPGEGGGGKFWRRIDEESSMGRPVPVTYNNNRGRLPVHQQMYPIYSNPNLPQMNVGYSNLGLQPGASTTLLQRQKRPKNKQRRRKVPKEIRKGAYVLGYNQLG